MPSTASDRRSSPPPIASVPPSVEPASGSATSTYGQILKSSALIGGSSLLNVGIGMVRAKVMALLLGPGGFGLMGLYWSIFTFVQSIAGMGINSAGVRQIAAAVGSGKTERVARTVAVLRRSSAVLGLIGAFALLLLSRPVSKITFGGYERAAPVALLSLAVLFRTMSDGRGALIQGMRHIADLAKSGALGGLFGAAASIALVYLFREQGLAPSVIAIEGIALLLAWWFSRKLRFEPPSLSLTQITHEAGALLRLGFAFMVSGMLTMGAAYVVRMIIVRQLGLVAAGFYQSAWTVGGLYVGFVLQAMGADFYPRLSAAAESQDDCNRLVNEQAQTSLLLAGPGVLATLTLAPLVIPLFYSAAFRDAVDVLRWLCLGVTLRVITWPMGFIIIAQARQKVFLLTEVAYTTAYLCVAWLCVRHFGLNGSGVAFFASYIFHGLMIYPIVRRLSGFRWSAASQRVAIPFLILIAGAFTAFYLLPPWPATGVGLLALAAGSVYSMRTLARLLSADRLPPAVRRLFAWTRLSP